MNVKINQSQFEKLLKFEKDRYIFGSQLHGITSKDSDSDYVIILDDRLYENFQTKAKYLPNIHSYQFDDSENNTQYILMTETQFYRGLFSGDGNMLADVVLLTENHPDYKDRMDICRTYKIIKGYLGVAKRDLKLHGNTEKKRFHASRSIYMAQMLLLNIPPTVQGIQNLKQQPLKSKFDLEVLEAHYREKLNILLDKGEINFYPKFIESDDIVQIMVDTNNIKEFKY